MGIFCSRCQTITGYYTYVVVVALITYTVVVEFIDRRILFNKYYLSYSTRNTHD